MTGQHQQNMERYILESNRHFIAENVIFECIKASLISTQLITIHQKSYIEDHKGYYNQANALITELLKSDLSITFPIFLQVLRDNGSPHIAKKLTSTSLEK